MNIVVDWLKKRGETVDDWDCVDLAGHLEEAHKGAELVWLEGSSVLRPLCLKGKPYGWQHHGVVELDGIVYDAWHPDLMLPMCDYIERAFPGQHVWPEYASDIIAGAV